MVWSAVRSETGQPVAVKVTAPRRLHVGQLMELAARETAILSRVTHEHIVRLHEVHPLADGSVAVVLDLADGGTLAGLLAARGRLDPGEVVTICTPIARALSALHDAGAVHGDLAPGNVFFTADGRPLLGDFEAARLVGESHPPVIAGTEGFIAPEVAAGEVPTEASDVFALGSLAWFALTGAPCRVDRRAGSDATPADGVTVSEASAVVGSDFGGVVARLLASDPRERPTAKEAAVLIYQAAAPAPVRLAGGAADSHPDQVLTHRLRAGLGAPTASLGTRDAPVAVVDARVRGRHRATTRRPARSRIAGAADVRRVASERRARATVKVVAASGAVVVVAALAAGMAVRQSPTAAAVAATVTATDASTVATAQTPPDGASMPPSAGSASPGPVARALPPALDAQVILGELVAARAHALTDRSAAALVWCDSAGSQLLANDLAIVEALNKADQRYAGLTFTVTSAERLGPAVDTMRVRAVVGRSAYRVVGPGREERTLAADPGRWLIYTLVAVEGGWRLADVTE